VPLLAEQELRRDLLFFSLSKWPDLDTAIEMAALMEQFILEGAGTGPSADPRVAGEGAGGGERPCAQSLPVEDCGSPGPGSGGSAAGETSSGCESPDLAGGQKRRWSAADDENLRRLWHSSQLLEDIAEEMGRTTPSLYCRARALGFSKRSVKLQSCSDSAAESAEQHRPAPAPAAVLERYRAQQRGGPKRSGQVRGGGDRRVGAPSRPVSSAARSVADEVGDLSIDPIIHFLRSRDYSVIRVEDGHFRLDGRRILSASELREKANQVRRTLGQPPFAAQPAEPVG
jgi:hypothetical protein